ncbi:hypothetical protein FB451DRAFT_1477643 [Mycena latifolia]|nr:hypothetical protein FB451DRAFT_1477643 [Mycena latifolia]
MFVGIPRLTRRPQASQLLASRMLHPAPDSVFCRRRARRLAGRPYAWLLMHSSGSRRMSPPLRATPSSSLADVPSALGRCPLVSALASLRCVRHTPLDRWNSRLVAPLPHPILAPLALLFRFLREPELVARVLPAPSASLADVPSGTPWSWKWRSAGARSFQPSLVFSTSASPPPLDLASLASLILAPLPLSARKIELVVRAYEHRWRPARSPSHRPNKRGAAGDPNAYSFSLALLSFFLLSRSSYCIQPAKNAGASSYVRISLLPRARPACAAAPSSSLRDTIVGAHLPRWLHKNGRRVPPWPVGQAAFQFFTQTIMTTQSVSST